MSEKTLLKPLGPRISTPSIWSLRLLLKRHRRAIRSICHLGSTPAGVYDTQDLNSMLMSYTNNPSHCADVYRKYTHTTTQKTQASSQILYKFIQMSGHHTQNSTPSSQLAQLVCTEYYK